MRASGDGIGVRVGYNKVLGGILLVLALLCLVAGALARMTPTIFIGALNTLLGVLYLTRPYFVVGPNAIELKNMLGMTMRRYDFGSVGELEATPDGKTIFRLEPNGHRSRLKLTRWLAHRPDWQRFVGVIQARAFE